MMQVAIGSREYGYKKMTIDFNNELTNYLKKTPVSFHNNIVEQNRRIVDTIKDKKIDYKKLAEVSARVAITTLSLTLLASGHGVFAAGHAVNVTPLENLVGDAYWTMFKVLSIVTTPIIAWIGYILMFSGASTEKRTTAKTIGKAVIVGSAFIAGAPWASSTLYHLWQSIF